MKISAPSSCGGTVGNCRVCCRTYPLVERRRDHLDNCSMEKTFSTYMQTSVVWRVCRQAHMLCILFASSGVTATSRLLCDKTTFTKEGKDRRIHKRTRWHIIMYNVNDSHSAINFCFSFCCRKRQDKEFQYGCDMNRFYIYWVLHLCHFENILIFLNIFSNS